MVADLRTDPLHAPLALDWFRSPRARTEAAPYLKELADRPLGGG